MFEIGTKAPDFTLNDNNGNEIKLSDFSGKWVVVYFYPRDNTSGCTKEACDFTDAADEFKELDAVILGISPDSAASHNKFIEKYSLKIKLLCDTEKSIIKEYKAWGEKKLYGKVSEGLIRTTYIIDPEGKIAAGWSPVKVRVKRKSGEVKHADIVKEKLKELK